jgi:hypothetical protein
MHLRLPRKTRDCCVLQPAPPRLGPLPRTSTPATSSKCGKIFILDRPRIISFLSLPPNKKTRRGALLLLLLPLLLLLLLLLQVKLRCLLL